MAKSRFFKKKKNLKSNLKIQGKSCVRSFKSPIKNSPGIEYTLNILIWPSLLNLIKSMRGESWFRFYNIMEKKKDSSRCVQVSNWFSHFGICDHCRPLPADLHICSVSSMSYNKGTDEITIKFIHQIQFLLYSQISFAKLKYIIEFKMISIWKSRVVWMLSLKRLICILK